MGRPTARVLGVVFVVAVGLATTVKLTLAVVEAEILFESLTAMTTLAVLYATFGVPLITPVEEFKVSPDGRVPELT